MKTAREIATHGARTYHQAPCLPSDLDVEFVRAGMLAALRELHRLAIQSGWIHERIASLIAEVEAQ